MAGEAELLLQYLTALKAIGLNPPQHWSPQGESAKWDSIDVEWVRRFDFSGSNARLIGSMPGRHTGAEKRCVRR